MNCSGTNGYIKKGYKAPNDYTSIDGVEFTKGDAVVDVQWYHRPHAASDGLLFKPEQLAVATLHAESIMRIDVEVTRGTYGRVSVPQECYDKLVGWYNETH